MKKRLSTFLIAVIFLLGCSLLLYPFLSNYINQLYQTDVINKYMYAVEQMSAEELVARKRVAIEYNTRLAEGKPLNQEEYGNLLNVRGILGYIEIPNASIHLSIKHGTEEQTLQKHAGHLARSSLPIGGQSTHAVITAHRGLPSAKLFTDLDKLASGDLFYLHVLDEVLAYQVDEIRVVLPEDTSSLGVVQDSDYVTLVTCTPYGINTHRLLIRGVRTEYVPDQDYNPAQKGPSHLWPLYLGIALVAIMSASILIYRKRGRTS